MYLDEEDNYEEKKCFEREFLYSVPTLTYLMGGIKKETVFKLSGSLLY